MKIKMLTRMAGPSGVVQPGKVIDHPDGKALVAGKYAIALDKPAVNMPENNAPEPKPARKK